VVRGADILPQWITACAGMTREEAAMTNALLLTSKGNEITITKRVYESRAHRVSQDGHVEGGSGPPLYLLRFVVHSGTVCGQDNFERPQAIEAARARRFTLGHAAQEIRQHERVHVLTHV
jgi:hypothetical protein